jgi:hypothetical protein
LPVVDDWLGVALVDLDGFMGLGRLGVHCPSSRRQLSNRRDYSRRDGAIRCGCRFIGQRRAMPRRIHLRRPGFAGCAFSAREEACPQRQRGDHASITQSAMFHLWASSLVEQLARLLFRALCHEVLAALRLTSAERPGSCSRGWP